jgi:uncharacterized protein YegL
VGARSALAGPLVAASASLLLALGGPARAGAGATGTVLAEAARAAQATAAAHGAATAAPREAPAAPPAVSAAPPAGGAAAALSAAASQPRGPDVWLRVDAPGPETRREGRLDWLRVVGRAGTGAPVEYDVALVIDVSGSTALASGVDVDGDGTVGRVLRRPGDPRSKPPRDLRHLCSDRGDTILDAELAASTRLVEGLAAGATRFAVISFADRARLEAPLSAERAPTQAALERLAGRFGGGYTNLADAIRVATDALRGADRDEAGRAAPRRPVILLLSDGRPTYPGSTAHAAARAREEAARAAEAGVALFTFGLGTDGSEASAARELLAELASTSGGASVQLARPGDVLYELPRLELAGVAAMEIENVSAASPGRALRVTADGNFDGYVPLVAGENRIRVIARGRRGGEERVDRIVHFVPRAPADAAEAARFAAEEEAFRRALQLRTVEAELALELEAARAGARRELEIEVPDAETTR